MSKTEAKITESKTAETTIAELHDEDLLLASGAQKPVMVMDPIKITCKPGGGCTVSGAEGVE